MKVMMLDWDKLLPAHPAPATQPSTTITDEPALNHDIVARQRDGDNRRYCTECGNLGTDRGICYAAQRGEIVTNRSYTPVRDILRRCEAFKPLPSDPDQTLGRDKWGWLADYSKPNAAPS
jgi:hypothetical protein